MRIARAVPGRLARRLTAFGMIAALLATTSCEDRYNEQPTPDREAQCAASNRKPLPTSTNILSVVDERYGNIYACMFLLDMGVPFAGSTPLVRIDEKQVESSEFSLKGNVGGGFLFFGILGAGGMNGTIEGSGRTTVRDVYLAVFVNADGVEQRVYLDAEKVKIRRYQPGSITKAGSPNDPSITFEIPDSPLFYRDDKIQVSLGADRPDRYSLWLRQADDTDYSADAKDVEEYAAQREAVLRQVSVITESDRDTGSGVTGGPRSVSDVVSALSSSIIVDLPVEATTK